MYNQHLSRFDLMRLLEKDPETRRLIAGISPVGDIKLEDLSDVNLSNLDDGDFLRYDESTDSWVNGGLEDTPHLFYSATTTEHSWEIEEDVYNSIKKGTLAVWIQDETVGTGYEWQTFKFKGFTQTPSLQAGYFPNYCYLIGTYNSKNYIVRLTLYEREPMPTHLEPWYGLIYEKWEIASDSEGVCIIGFNKDDIQGEFVADDKIEYITTQSTIIKTPNYTYYFDHIDDNDAVTYQTQPYGQYDDNENIHVAHMWVITVDSDTGEIKTRVQVHLHGEMYCIDMTPNPTPRMMTDEEYQALRNNHAYMKYNTGLFFLSGRGDTSITLATHPQLTSTDGSKQFIQFCVISEATVGYNANFVQRFFLTVPEAQSADAGKAVIVDPEDVSKLKFRDMQPGANYVISLTGTDTSGVITDEDDLDALQTQPENVVITWNNKVFRWGTTNQSLYTKKTWECLYSKKYSGDAYIYAYNMDVDTITGAYIIKNDMWDRVPTSDRSTGDVLKINSSGYMYWGSLGINHNNMIHADDSRVQSVFGNFVKIGNVVIINVGMQAKIDIIDNRRIAYIDTGMRPASNLYIYPSFYSNRPSGTAQVQIKTDGDLYYSGSATISQNSYFMLTGVYLTNE